MSVELTTVEAALLLNISRPHLIKQLAARELPFHMVGCACQMYSPTATTPMRRPRPRWMN